MAFKHVARMTRYLQGEGWDDEKIIDLIQYIGEGRGAHSGHNGDYYDRDEEDLDTTYVISAEDLMKRLQKENKTSENAVNGFSYGQDRNEPSDIDEGSDETLRISYETDNNSSIGSGETKESLPSADSRDESQPVQSNEASSSPKDKTDQPLTDRQASAGSEAPLEAASRPSTDTAVEARKNADRSEGRRKEKAAANDRPKASLDGKKQKETGNTKKGISPSNEKRTGSGDQTPDNKVPAAGAGSTGNNASIKENGDHQNPDPVKEDAADNAEDDRPEQPSANNRGKESPDGSKYTITKEIEKTDVTYSVLNIKIKNFDGSIAKTNLLTTPLESTNGVLRFMTLRNDKNVRAVYVSDNGSSLELDIYGYPVTLTSYMEDGAYHTRCELPSGYKKDGTTITYEERCQTGKGHLILKQGDIYYHIAPAAFINSKKHEDLTAVFVCAERPDGTMESGLSDADMRVRMNLDGNDLEITASWEDGHLLRPQIRMA